MSGPLRPRTEAFSSLTGRIASQGWRRIGDIRTTVPAYAGFTPLPCATTECRLTCRWRGISW
ncbi:hypothetical protein D6I96_25590 [Escherichia coli]|uniref:Uncharacterized protein n=1 Tax=Escherichia coli TaxID=562 RepID=A0AAN3NZD1_ECOLX|nr:hypothetical protein [Escherichia coli]EEW8085767.1 hypothetical protein [Escherichia coli]EFB2214623.1 hypothetical protein [Escherichia coli]EFB9412240.1 hypothetical protein [Escherichia coli]EFB9445494.1 hypothetical protein [Escherichia coli]